METYKEKELELRNSIDNLYSLQPRFESYIEETDLFIDKLLKDTIKVNELQRKIDKAIEYCECHFKTMVADEEAQEVIEILKGE